MKQRLKAILYNVSARPQRRMTNEPTHYNRKRKQGEHLRYEDRVLLEHYVRENDARPRKRKWSQRKIAHEVGISPATTSRELKRGEVELKRSDLSVYKSYSAVVAQIDCEAKWKGRGPGLKIGKDHAFAEYVERQILEKNYSPDAIVMELKREGNPFQTSVCTRTLYHYIEIGVFLTVSRDNLRRHGEKPKREYCRVRRAYRGDGKSIIDRPESAETRAEPGHSEMDYVVSGKGKGRACLLTMVDRMTREAKLFKLPS